MKKRILLGSIAFIVLLSSVVSYLMYKKHEEDLNRENTILEIKSHYNKYVKTNKKANLYVLNNDKYEVQGFLSSNLELTLDSIIIDSIDDNYFYIPSLKMYIEYKDVDILDNLTEYSSIYKNYIPFNENIIIKENSKMYIDDDTYYSFANTLNLPIIIKEEDRYYAEYDNKLVYILKDDIEKIIENNNSNAEIATSIAVLNYHFVISKEASEDKECLQGICIYDTQFEEEMKYLSDNNYYTVTMNDFELWMDKKINLPKKSVNVTVDDGWYVERNIKIIEKYNIHETLFLIGSLASPNAYISPNLEIHSHGWNIHNIGDCAGTSGGAILCKDKTSLLNDLALSRASLNNTTVFCFPFYEYNNYALGIIKEAGFTMSFIGGMRKATQDTNKYLIPRYSIWITTTMAKFISYIS